MKTSYGVTRNDLLAALADAANDNGYVGTLVWDLWTVPPATSDGYSFQFGDDGSAAMLQTYQHAKTASNS